MLLLIETKTNKISKTSTYDDFLCQVQHLKFLSYQCNFSSQKSQNQSEPTIQWDNWSLVQYYSSTQNASTSHSSEHCDLTHNSEFQLLDWYMLINA